jgi:hypothetical protein
LKPTLIKTVIIQMKHPQSKKEIQKLAGRIAALNGFIAKLAERSLPFFTVTNIKSETRSVVNSIHLRFTQTVSGGIVQAKEITKKM